jgi:CheY-like chemotaxis protein
MPGISGLETLAQIKNKNSLVPVVMITKSEEEQIMEDAIGSKISDYLIKPVNPNQILLTIKKNLDTKRLVRETTSHNYQKEFREISMKLSDRLDYQEWKEVYKKLVFWELELQRSKDEGMGEIWPRRKVEANNQFFKWIERNYQEIINGKMAAAPVLSHTLFKTAVAPKLGKGKPTYFIVIDNLRWDQWQAIRPAVLDILKLEKEDMYMGILPTATQYSRNAIFAGLTPLEIERSLKINGWTMRTRAARTCMSMSFLPISCNVWALPSSTATIK